MDTVFLGVSHVISRRVLRIFLAEYGLKHIIEHQRERQYARTLFEVINKGTAALQAAMNTNLYVTFRIDSFAGWRKLNQSISYRPVVGIISEHSEHVISLYHFRMLLLSIEKK